MTQNSDSPLASLLTEQRNPRSTDIDTLSTVEIVRMINSEDKGVAHAVEAEIPYIGQAVDILVEGFMRGGRLIYVGAGTSGRLGVLDAAECPPTFGVSPNMVQGMIAGGRDAMFTAVEGAEDNEEAGLRDIEAIKPTSTDVVCGIAASRRTPYVVAAIGHARKLGARTIYITTNPRERFDLDVDVAICPAVGPEVIMGSTRMKSGTAQKMVLNMLTTTAMIKLGKVYENMMVDLQLVNEKLVDRARRIVMTVTGKQEAEVIKVLEEAGGHVKTALVMLMRDVDATRARTMLARVDGFVRKAMFPEQ